MGAEIIYRRIYQWVERSGETGYVWRVEGSWVATRLHRPGQQFVGATRAEAVAKALRPPVEE